MDEMNNELVHSDTAPPPPGVIPSSQITIDLEAKTASAPDSIHVVEGTFPFGVFLPTMGIMILPDGFKSSQPTSKFDLSGVIKFIETSAPIILNVIKKFIESKSK